MTAMGGVGTAISETQQAAPVSKPIAPSELDAFVDGMVADGMKSDHIAGVSVAVVQGGRPILLKGYGAASLAPWRAVTPDTIFRLGSTTKTFTWIALMREVEKGRVKLDDPVNAYLPAELRFPQDGFSRPILVQDLMDHSAGVEDQELAGMLVNDPKKVVALRQYLLVHRPRRVREPGTDASYCNYCAGLAGYIVARLEGEDYETIVERDIAAPLGMTSTTFRDPRPAIKGLPAPMPRDLVEKASDGFTWSNGDFRKEKPELGSVPPAGSAWSNASDMARYMIAQLNGGERDGVRIYSPQTAQAFRTPLLKMAPGINGWDHGFMELPLPGGFTSYGHGGDTALFHGDMVVVPALDLGIYVVTNTDTGAKFAKRLPDLIVDHFYGGAVRASTAPAKIDAAAIEPYEGTWISSRRDYHGLEGFIELLQATKIDAVNGGLAGVGSRIYVPDGPGRFRQKDGPYVLTFDLKDGKAVKYRTSDNIEQGERAKWWQDPLTYLLLLTGSIVAAVATLSGLFVRRRDLPRSGAQGAAGQMQTAAALAWLTALGALALWVPSASSAAAVVFNWPGPFITIFAWAGLGAAVLSLAGLVMLLPIWRGQGWAKWRKLRYTATAVIFAAVSLLTFLRGGLDVWTL